MAHPMTSLAKTPTLQIRTGGPTRAKYSEFKNNARCNAGQLFYILELRWRREVILYARRRNCSQVAGAIPF